MASIVADLPDNWEELLRVTLPTDVVLDPFEVLVVREANFPGFVSVVAE